MKYATYSFLLIACLATSCKDDPPAPSPETYCSDNPGACETVMEGKKYFAFGMGSWWVYEEENSGDRDSVYVTESMNNPDGYEFDVRVKSNSHPYYYHYWPQYINTSACSLHGESPNKCMFISRSKGKQGEYIGEDYCLFVNFKKGDSKGVTNVNYPFNKIEIYEVFPNYILNQLNFGKTVVVKEDHTFIENNQLTYHYFSKNVGLIRRELVDSNQIWNLVNYHIEQ